MEGTETCDWVLLDEGGSEVAAGRSDDAIALTAPGPGYYRLIGGSVSDLSTS